MSRKLGIEQFNGTWKLNGTDVFYPKFSLYFTIRYLNLMNWNHERGISFTNVKNRGAAKLVFDILHTVMR